MKLEMIVPGSILGQNITNSLKKLQVANVVYVLSAKAGTLDGNARKYAGHIYCSVDFLKRRKPQKCLYSASEV